MYNFIRITLIFCFTVLLVSCGEPRTNSLKEGIWLAELQTQDDYDLPFNFKLYQDENGKVTMEVYNADEVIYVDEITLTKDSFLIKLPVFEGYLSGTYTPKLMKGVFAMDNLERKVPFRATYGVAERFKTGEEPKYNVSGAWETVFNPNTEKQYMAEGVFKQLDGRVTGTFRTTTGDYRFLEGVQQGDSLKLSTFNGAHAYLFKAKVSDSLIDGVFYSGNHFQAPFSAKRNENFQLPEADGLTYLKEGYDKLEFSFPDADGNMVSLEDEQFKNQVVVVQIMGTWCPNCLDETKFLVEYLEENKSKDVSVVALAFEYVKTPEAAFKAINRLKDRIGVEYPILLAQYASSDKSLAQDKLPMLNHILSYPTTIILDRKGAVRKIHTGFNGPATGNNYLSFKKDFYSFIDELLAEE
ncbi:peroxiredoxin family protein [Arenibacter amylolyticus]|uniref:peroxiredoxin family protein n=1 Tax=Arenibacter amylolyticus TaxID=1406873 RepID=UPI001FEC2FC4|nr:TlpA disulfide reductase family protein [Arenibacter amylolyticus]